MTGFGEIAERLRRSTVQVFDGSETGAGGSGIIFDSAGAIVTNAHVVSGSTAEIKFWDGERLSAKVLQHDRNRDLAVLQVGSSRPPVCADIASTAPRVGEIAIAVGNPLGFIGAVSTGVVHAVGSVAGIGPRPWVQTTVRLAPGSSGGPLANTRGEIIGVNTMIVAREAMGNLALAIPIASVLQLISEPKTARVSIGITVRPVSIPGERGPGFLVLQTAPNQPADRASLLIGDLLVGANGRRFLRFSDLQEAIDSAAAGGLLALQFRRGGAASERTVTIQVEQRRAAA